MPYFSHESITHIGSKETGKQKYTALPAKQYYRSKSDAYTKGGSEHYRRNEIKSCIGEEKRLVTIKRAVDRAKNRKSSNTEKHYAVERPRANSVPFFARLETAFLKRPSKLRAVPITAPKANTHDK